jgi:(1->4)-alpha-D-glucan 1-alpha-D-glucosylmutase
LRVDHVDGLADPAGYLERLTSDLTATGGDRPSVLVEKILAATETMPRWPIEGTTGYEFARQVLGLFIDPDGFATLAEEYRVRTGDDRTFADRQWDAKHKVLSELFPAQLDRTTAPFTDALRTARPGSDVSRTDLEGALSGLICALPVYRTYGAGSGPMTKADASVVSAALDHVRSASDPEVTRAATLLAGLITGGVQPPSEAFADARRRFQQLAVAVMAKGSEDTALFDPGVPLAGVEVGGQPDAPAVGAGAFHHAMADRLRAGGLNTTSTHDTKRSEEVRARLAVLTEFPSLWLLTLDRWRRMHARFAGSCDVAEEIYLYETIVGLASPGTAASPGFRRRIVDHTQKAAREAKRRTSWTDPDPAHERDLERLVTAVLSRGNVAFHRDLERTLGRIAEPARVNALGMTVVKVAAPGIPDIYQGTEGGAASLTDPDNRRPVPFDAYARMLSRSGPGAFDPRATPAPSAAVPDPLKLSVTAGALRVRRDDPELFDRGSYRPIEPWGEHSDHLVAFARTRNRRSAICVVTRGSGSISLSGGRVAGRTWGETGLLLPSKLQGRYADALTGEIHALGSTVPIAPVLASLPVALLVRQRP